MRILQIIKSEFCPEYNKKKIKSCRGPSKISKNNILKDWNI